MTDETSGAAKSNPPLTFPAATEIAFTAVASDATDDPEDEEPIPLCTTCGAPAAFFLEVILNWRHFRGAATAAGAHETYDQGPARLRGTSRTRPQKSSSQPAYDRARGRKFGR
jgi:hypothetical protein